MKVKICGLKNKRDAEYVNEAGADLAGFVLFFPKSKRNLTIQQAKEIMSVLRPEIKKVAVVVSPDRTQLMQIEEAGFDYVQIHGSISADQITSLHLPVLKAFNVKDIMSYPDYAGIASVAGFVFDAAEPGAGKTFDWNLLKQVTRNDKLFILAGGLNQENVARAVKEVRPDVIDVSSGVEDEAGEGKDRDKVIRFVETVREATGKEGKES